MALPDVIVRFGFNIVEQPRDDAKQLEAQYSGVDALHRDLKLIEQDAAARKELAELFEFPEAMAASQQLQPQP